MNWHGAYASAFAVAVFWLLTREAKPSRFDVAAAVACFFVLIGAMYLLPAG